MTTKRFCQNLIACVVLLCAAAGSGAAEFWSHVPGNGSLKVNNASGGSGFAPVSVTGYTGVGGQFTGHFWSGGALPADSFFRFFCIDLAQHANAGPNPYASSLLNDDHVRKLYDIAYPNKQFEDFWNGGQTDFGVFGNATAAAAFQVALWNLYFDHDLSLAAGSFQWTGAASSPVGQAAQTLLNQVGSYSGDGYQRWTLYRFTNASYQDYLSATYRVPEPAAFGLVLVALMALAFTARRRQRA